MSNHNKNMERFYIISEASGVGDGKGILKLYFNASSEKVGVMWGIGDAGWVFILKAFVAFVYFEAMMWFEVVIVRIGLTFRTL